MAVPPPFVLPLPVFAFEMFAQVHEVVLSLPPRRLGDGLHIDVTYTLFLQASVQYMFTILLREHPRRVARVLRRVEPCEAEKIYIVYSFGFFKITSFLKL